jgi:hypothetical protein
MKKGIFEYSDQRPGNWIDCSKVFYIHIGRNITGFTLSIGKYSVLFLWPKWAIYYRCSPIGKIIDITIDFGEGG